MKKQNEKNPIIVIEKQPNIYFAHLTHSYTHISFISFFNFSFFFRSVNGEKFSDRHHHLCCKFLFCFYTLHLYFQPNIVVVSFIKLLLFFLPLWSLYTPFPKKISSQIKPLFPSNFFFHWNEIKFQFYIFSLITVILVGCLFGWFVRWLKNFKKNVMIDVRQNEMKKMAANECNSFHLIETKLDQMNYYRKNR